MLFIVVLSSFFLFRLLVRERAENINVDIRSLCETITGCFFCDSCEQMRYVSTRTFSTDIMILFTNTFIFQYTSMYIHPYYHQANRCCKVSSSPPSSDYISDLGSRLVWLDSSHDWSGSTRLTCVQAYFFTKILIRSQHGNIEIKVHRISTRESVDNLSTIRYFRQMKNYAGVISKCTYQFSSLQTGSRKVCLGVIANETRIEFARAKFLLNCNIDWKCNLSL